MVMGLDNTERQDDECATSFGRSQTAWAQSDTVPPVSSAILKTVAPYETSSGQISDIELASARPKRTKRPARHDATSGEDEPLIDATVELALHSKKTERLQRRQQRKSARKFHSEIKSFLELPSELLSLVFSFLQPSEIFPLLRLNRSTRAFILDNERPIAESVFTRRYWVLRKCFPLPMWLEKVPASARPALLSDRWQDRLRIHKNPYQHIKPIDPSKVCTCMSCVLAWNNLCIVLDLAHWQKNLEGREPLPAIPRGRNPEWNVELLERNAGLVERAMQSPLAYARILQKHLDTTTRTIIRHGKWRKKGETKPRQRLYQLTDSEASSGVDAYLERSGPPSYQPIYMRDLYYSVEAFVPNRKWSKEEQRWHYYSPWPRPHENDLAWLVARFAPDAVAEQRMDAWTKAFEQRLTT